MGRDGAGQGGAGQGGEGCQVKLLSLRSAGSKALASVSGPLDGGSGVWRARSIEGVRGRWRGGEGGVDESRGSF